MIGVKHQSHVHGSSHFFVRFLSIQHEQEVFGMIQVLTRSDRVLVSAEPIERGHDRRKDGDQVKCNLPPSLIRVHIHFRRPDGTEHGHTGTKDVHRPSGIRCQFNHLLDPVRQLSASGEVVLKRIQFVLSGKFTVPQKFRDFLERGVFREILNGYSAVHQPSLVTKNLGQGRVCYDNTF